MEEPLGTVRSKVEKASSQKVRVGAKRRWGGILSCLPFILFVILLQGQQRERNHATGQRGKLSLSILIIILPGFESRDRVWREEEAERGYNQSNIKDFRRGGESFNPWVRRVLHGR